MTLPESSAKPYFRGKFRDPQGPARLFRMGDLNDKAFRQVCRLAALSVIALLVLLIVLLVKESIPALKHFGARFLITNDWDPRGDLGALPFVYGTLVTSALAMLLAVPFGVATATFLAEIASSSVRRIGSFLIELLAAIPSVVYGFWGYYFLRPLVSNLFTALGGPSGSSGLGLVSAGLILSIMILPYITAITFDVCQAVPRSQREGALALGATRWQMIWRVILPYARSGIVGGCFLALGRALGETMAVVMLIGNSTDIEASIFGKGSTIASVIANKLNEAQSNLERSALVELGLILLVVTIVINCLARLLLWRVGRTRGKRSWISRVASSTSGSTNGQPTGLEAAIASGNVEKRPGLPKNLKALWFNNFMTVMLGSSLAITLGPLFLILGYIAFRGFTALDWNFFTRLPNNTPPGLAHALYGSAMLVGLATLCAVPVGLLAAVFLVEYGTSRLAPVVRFVGELLGGVPSIVIGILGYALLVGPFNHFSGWAGIFSLSIMMVPIVMRAAEESLKLVPQSLRNASYALGAAQWQTVLKVTVPAALPAIITGIFLAIARIAGETAPLLLTADSTNYWAGTPNGRTPYLTYYIYNYSQMPDAEQQRLAWAAAFVLLAIVMFLNIGIRLATGKRLVSAARAD